jgi:putative addiction module component (TIGR02574 family)
MPTLHPSLAHLPVAEKLQLIAELWDSIERERQAALLPLSDWQREELDRRKADALLHPDDVLTWDEVKTLLLTASAWWSRFSQGCDGGYSSCGELVSARRGLGTAFQQELERCLNRIAENPLQAPKCYGDYRRMLLNRFPYEVIYECDQDGRVVIYAVMHTARAPEQKSGRLSLQ